MNNTLILTLKRQLALSVEQLRTLVLRYVIESSEKLDRNAEKDNYKVKTEKLKLIPKPQKIIIKVIVLQLCTRFTVDCLENLSKKS